jgi:hypothetical protein
LDLFAKLVPQLDVPNLMAFNISRMISFKKKNVSLPSKTKGQEKGNIY